MNADRNAADWALRAHRRWGESLAAFDRSWIARRIKAAAVLAAPRLEASRADLESRGCLFYSRSWLLGAESGAAFELCLSVGELSPSGRSDPRQAVIKFSFRTPLVERLALLPLAFMPVERAARVMERRLWGRMMVLALDTRRGRHSSPPLEDCPAWLALRQERGLRAMLPADVAPARRPRSL